jgi:hypothetical protein
MERDYPVRNIREGGGQQPVAMKPNNASKNQNHHATFVFVCLSDYPLSLS